jgi:uncharacterized protein YndB with AHSA1/START domain
MIASNTAPATTQVFEIYIKTNAQAIWDAITQPEWTARYGYGGRADYQLRAGGAYRMHASDEMCKMGLPEIIIDGEVLECSPPHKLVQTYRWLFTEQNEAEGYTRVTFEIVDTGHGFCRLTVTHEMEKAPLMATATRSKFSVDGGGGWNWVLSDLKSLLETGKTLASGG